MFCVAAIGFPANKNMLKFNNRNTREKCEISSKLKLKTSERRQNQWLKDKEEKLA